MGTLGLGSLGIVSLLAPVMNTVVIAGIVMVGVTGADCKSFLLFLLNLKNCWRGRNPIQSLTD